ncbi:TonB family protein [Pedobacter frigoris]|uniref:TonB family protein n=1 Tax=Pedobacter frigoris TaxID=2571272 RepID=UPI00292D8BCC|nr:TonB family protein [Pedobacter frigoris]
MKKITLLVALLLFAGLTNAQKRKNIYLFKNNGKPVSLQDSADYIRVIEEPDSGAVYFKLMEYYVNGKPKTIGSVSKFEPALIYEGQFATYDDKGNKQTIFNYEANKPVGKGYYFFSNGKLNKVVDFDGAASNFAGFQGQSRFNQPSKLDYYVDSLGQVLVENGNGHFKITVKAGSENYLQEGEYVGGEKDGLWTEKNASGDFIYKEKYLKGKLLSGESYKDGKTYLYAVTDEFPTYQNGIQAFYAYLSRTVRYPRDAQDQNISGTVLLSFVVEKDGKVADAEVTRGVYPSLDDEALRVMRISPKWIPGKQRGVPMRVKYNVPIKFSLR